MKNKDLKKGKESIIGKNIYGFLLFMPLLAILSTILVNIFNKEVTQPTQETEITYKYETNEVNSFDDLISGHIYQFVNDEIDTGINEQVNYNFAIIILNPQECSITFNNMDLDDTDFYGRELTGEFPLNFNLDFYMSDNGLTISNNDVIDLSFSFQSVEFENVIFQLDYIEKYGDVDYLSQYITSTTYNEIESVEITTQDTSVNDIFYYAVDKVEQSNLFNWSKNSIIYTGIHNTCTQLSITTTFVPMLLAYWLIISVIYILYDIILMILIILHNRIHRLQESI